MQAVNQVMFLKGMDPTIMSVFHDLIDLEKKMIKRTSKISNLKQKQKMSLSEVTLRKVTLDNYIKK